MLHPCTRTVDWAMEKPSAMPLAVKLPLSSKTLNPKALKP